MYIIRVNKGEVSEASFAGCLRFPVLNIGRDGAEGCSHRREVGEDVEQAEDFAVFLGRGPDGCAVGGGCEEAFDCGGGVVGV